VINSDYIVMGVTGKSQIRSKAKISNILPKVSK